MVFHETRDRRSWMEIEFDDPDLDRLETDISFDAGLSRDIVKAFRKRIQSIRAAVDERDLAAVRGNNFEKLKGNRSHQYSMRLNKQWRLILELKSARPKNVVIVISIE